jgi:hypothetical protein
MRQHRIRAIAGAAVAAFTLILPTTPADASITGGLLFTCEADLPTFPSPAGGGVCDPGLVPASALGVGAGIDAQGDPYVVTGLGTFNASFNYNETCPPGPALPLPPPVGTAVGSASITGLTAVHGTATMGARIDTQFRWVRVGLTAVIITFNTRITFSNGHIAVSASPASGTADDGGGAAFVPIPTPGNCAAPAHTRAVVAGVDVVPV